MSIFILFFLHMITNAKAMEEVAGKVIGGTATKIEIFPYAVRFFNKDSFCSGTILNGWTVMTAAHCIEVSHDVEDMMIGVGTNYLQDYSASIYDVTSYVIHENYSKPMLFASDIALLFVGGPIKFGKTVQKAILCPNMEWANISQINGIVVMGWGWTQEKNSELVSVLQAATLRYVPLSICEKVHNMKFSKDMFCLYGDGIRDTCKGDSGGGVVWKGQIIGIVSHGHGCAEKGRPSLYLNVWYYRQWIRQQIGKFIENYCNEKQGIHKKEQSINRFHG